MTKVTEGNGESFVSRNSYSLRDLFLGDPLRRIMTYSFAITTGLTIATGLTVGLKNLFQDNLLYQQQIIGSSIPDVYIETNGVKYFSHIDGRSIEEIVSQNSLKK